MKIDTNYIWLLLLLIPFGIMVFSHFWFKGPSLDRLYCEGCKTATWHIRRRKLFKKPHKFWVCLSCEQKKNTGSDQQRQSTKVEN